MSFCCYVLGDEAGRRKIRKSIKLTKIFNSNLFLYFVLKKSFFEKFDLLQILGGTTCALFNSRYCIDSRFSTSKVVEDFFLQFFFMSVYEKLNLLHKHSKYKNLFRFPLYYHVAEWSDS